MNEKEIKIKTEIYSRVSGYMRPTSQWNRGKQSEFSERNFAFIKSMEDIGVKDAVRNID